MSKYVLAFRARPGRTPAAGEDEQWGAWFGQLGPAIVDMGGRVGATRTVAAARRGDPASSVLSGYVIIEAAGLDEAAALAQGCPGLAHEVDVEVAEIIGS